MDAVITTIVTTATDLDRLMLPSAARHPSAMSADTVIRARTIHTFDNVGTRCSSLAIREGKVIALGDAPTDLDELVGPGTHVVDHAELVLLPAFHDTHNHQLWTSRDLDAVHLQGATCIGEIIDLIAKRAQQTKPGEWITTARSWHESTIVERRLPTAAELDRATAQHPVLVRRGGHVGVANSLALSMAGLNRASDDPSGGTIVRDPAGHPNGQLIEFAALAPVVALLPTLNHERQVENLRRMGLEYNARGIASVRDPGIYRSDMHVYQSLWERAELSVRSNVMIRLDAAWSTAEKISEIEAWGVRTGFGDDMLRLGGLKMFVDGGVEGGALSQGYTNDPDFTGHLFATSEEIAQVVSTAVAHGWRVGCHAVGDVAMTTILDAYESVTRQRPGLPRGSLVIEHAFFADAEQRRRAITLGVAITVQHPLVYSLAGNMVGYWGEERTAQVLPVRAWVEEGAMVAAGSDCNVADFDPLRSIWGLVTRETKTAGPRGREHAVDRRTAMELYTVAGAKLLGEEAKRGALVPGRYADIVAFSTDPLLCPIDDLPGLAPLFTLVGGAAVYDPAHNFERNEE